MWQEKQKKKQSMKYVGWSWHLQVVVFLVSEGLCGRFAFLATLSLFKMTINKALKVKWGETSEAQAAALDDSCFCNMAVRSFGSVRRLLLFYVCTSAEATGIKHSGSVSEAHCHRNLSDSSLKLRLSLSHSLCFTVNTHTRIPTNVYICICIH